MLVALRPRVRQIFGCYIEHDLLLLGKANRRPKDKPNSGANIPDCLPDRSLRPEQVSGSASGPPTQTRQLPTFKFSLTHSNPESNATSCETNMLCDGLLFEFHRAHNCMPAALIVVLEAASRVLYLKTGPEVELLLPGAGEFGKGSSTKTRLELSWNRSFRCGPWRGPSRV